MYQAIDRNKRITVLIILSFVILTIGFTLLISYVWTNDLYASIFFGFFAFIISLFSGLLSYYAGASIVLSMSGATEVTDNPNYKELNDRVETLAIKAGIPKPRIYIIDDAALNAFATGRDPKHAYIAFTLGLLNGMTWEEIEAVAAHELGHVKNYDIRLTLIVSVLAGIITFLGEMFLRGLFFSNNDNEERNNPIAFVAAIAFAILAPIAAVLVQLAISRRREYLADMTSVEITRYPQSMINALERLKTHHIPVKRATSGTAHMYIDNPLKRSSGIIAGLFATHPPIEDRIKAIQNL